MSTVAPEPARVAPIKGAFRVKFNDLPKDFRKRTNKILKEAERTPIGGTDHPWGYFLEGVYGRDPATQEWLAPGLFSLYYYFEDHPALSGRELEGLAGSPAIEVGLADVEARDIDAAEWAAIEWVARRALGLPVGRDPRKKLDVRFFRGERVTVVGKPKDETLRVELLDGAEAGTVLVVPVSALAFSAAESLLVAAPAIEVKRARGAKAPRVLASRFGNPVSALDPEGEVAPIQEGPPAPKRKPAEDDFDIAPEQLAANARALDEGDAD